MRPLKEVSPWDIQCGKDKVYDIETDQYGTLDVRTHNEALDIYVKWNDSKEYVPLNEYDTRYFFVKV